MLVMMTITHLPTRFSEPLSQSLGFVSAAEGFVLLSAFIAGSVYTRRAQQHGFAAMRQAFFRRALKLYACQMVMLLFLFTVIAKIGVFFERPAIINLLSFYFHDPITALWSGFALIYSPPLVDILPLYVIFMLASPWVLTYGLRGGWTWIMVISVGCWFFAQFGLATVLYDAAVVVTHLPVPFGETGAFEMFAWQFLWILGLWMGSCDATEDADAHHRFSPWVVVLAVTIAVACFTWRRVVGQLPFGPDDGLNLLFDKWRLGPLRLINLFALLVLTLQFGPWLKSLRRWRFLETLGAASLPVFCAHLVIVLLVLALGSDQAESSIWIDLALIAGSFSVLYVIARIAQPLHLGAALSLQEKSQAVTVDGVR
jgi:hypothetical protein